MVDDDPPGGSAGGHKQLDVGHAATGWLVGFGHSATSLIFSGSAIICTLWIMWLRKHLTFSYCHQVKGIPEVQKSPFHADAIWAAVMKMDTKKKPQHLAGPAALIKAAASLGAESNKKQSNTLKLVSNLSCWLPDLSLVTFKLVSFECLLLTCSSDCTEEKTNTQLQDLMMPSIMYIDSNGSQLEIFEIPKVVHRVRRVQRSLYSTHRELHYVWKA